MRKRPPPFTAEHRANLSAARKGIPVPHLHTPESIAKSAANRKGKNCGPRPPELGMKISATHKRNGVRPSKECIEKSLATNRGRKLSPEHRAKISAANAGSKRGQYKKHSPEANARKSERMRARKRPSEWIVPAFPPVFGVSLTAALAAIVERGEAFYVYVLRRPSGAPFYVGKGRRDRIGLHERDAINGNLYRHRVMREALRSGAAIGYELVGFYDNESDAFAEERRLIAFYGRFDQRKGPLTNKTDGGEGASDPSAETIAKRVIGLKAAMSDPVRKAAALARIHSPEARAKAVIKIKQAHHTDAARKRNAERMRAQWADPDKRAKHVAAIRAAALDRKRAA